MQELLPFIQRLVNNSGLCGDCTHARIIKSDRGSTFVQCQLSFTDSRFAKYPPLPVRKCDGYARKTGSQEEVV
jgi:hypothetical protein